jgi:hypothetical protein
MQPLMQVGIKGEIGGTGNWSIEVCLAFWHSLPGFFIVDMVVIGDLECYNKLYIHTFDWR